MRRETLDEEEVRFDYLVSRLRIEALIVIN